MIDWEPRPAPRTIHVLVAGRTLCGLLGIPRDWPPGHVWVRSGEWFAATCPTCLVAAEAAYHRDRTE